MVKVASIKNIVKDLKPRQKKTMNSHARHHSLKHMRLMARLIKFLYSVLSIFFIKLYGKILLAIVQSDHTKNLIKCKQQP